MPGVSGRVLLLGSVFAVAACGLAYELSAAAVSAWLLGDAVFWFSVVVGLYLCAMGVGAWAARFVAGDALTAFVGFEVWTGLIGGLSSLLCFAVGAAVRELFVPVFLVVLVSVGTLVGLEIPLLIRALRERGDSPHAVSDTLALDYAGALVGSLALPLLALPWLGPPRASLAFGLVNLGVAWVGTALLPKPWPLRLRAVAAAAVLAAALLLSGGWTRLLEDRLYADTVIHSERSAYQHIVLTRWRDDVRLYLDGALQFSAVDERRYHEALVVPGLAYSAPNRVLVLGGGDGLAVARILEQPEVQEVAVVDLDAAVTRLARGQADLRALNGGGLEDPRVTVIHDDAMRFLEQDRRFWDLIVVDLPDPNHEGLARLYSTAFVELALRRLSVRGHYVTQATSPFFAPEAFWCIVRTVEEVAVPAGFDVRPYHLGVPSFGEWGWVIAGPALARRALPAPTIPTRALDLESARAMFHFPPDLARPAEVAVERLSAPTLARLYRKGWVRFRGGSE